MKKNLLLVLIVLLGILTKTPANHFITLSYFKNDTLDLKLDFFLPESTETKEVPLIIYVHGGGFSSGNRSEGHAFCRNLSERGYAAASISYTLYMQTRNFGCKGILSEKIKAIQIGVNDLWLATNYFIENRNTFHIDTSAIFIAGKSAGAETVFHAAFWDSEQMRIYPYSLPANFQYKGIIAGAGAIMDLNLIQASNAIPVFMFHGNCDNTVPYATAAHHFCKPADSGWLMLFGSSSIYKHYSLLGKSAHLVTYCGEGHESCHHHFHDKDPEHIFTFLQCVLGNRLFLSHEIVKTGKNCKTSDGNKLCN